LYTHHRRYRYGELKQSVLPPFHVGYKLAWVKLLPIDCKSLATYFWTFGSK
jgi:hypothetical protein